MHPPESEQSSRAERVSPYTIAALKKAESIISRDDGNSWVFAQAGAVAKRFNEALEASKTRLAEGDFLNRIAYETYLWNSDKKAITTEKADCVKIVRTLDKQQLGKWDVGGSRFIATSPESELALAEQRSNEMNKNRQDRLQRWTNAIAAAGGAIIRPGELDAVLHDIAKESMSLSSLEDPNKVS